jgi:hypothetical protein
MKTGPKPRNKSQLQLALDSYHGKGTYTIVSFSSDTNTHKVRHYCGNVFSVQLGNLLRKKPTVKCSCEYKRIMAVTRKMHCEEVVQIRGPDLELVKFVKGKRSKCTYRHKVCKKTWQTTRDSFNLSKGCPHCNGQFGILDVRLDLNNIQSSVNKVHGKGQYRITRIMPRNSRGRTDRIMIKHKCGHEYEGSQRQLRDGKNRCPKCFGSRGGSTKEINISGHIFKCQGHEPILLPVLVKHFHLTDIISSRDPNMIRIKYKFKSTWRTYIPDFYIPSRNIIVEVKSPSTLGLVRDVNEFFGDNLLERMQSKAKRCKKLGYKFYLFLYGNNGNKRIKLPHDWISMDKYQLAAAVGLKM